jgi:hypothetical protein
MALAGRTASVDIPKPRGSDLHEGRDTFAAVAAGSVSVNNKRGQATANPLPTPPNSISPNLPPLGLQRKHHRDMVGFTTFPPPADVDEGYAPMQVDSDIDLHDGFGHARGSNVQHTAAGTTLSVADTAGTITPGLLAKYHLPEILLTHGPLAIRHVMAYLATSVPGFSGVPPAKARRLVVGALEGRGSGGEGGGVEGNVEFEKVGWGRWDARVKGQPSRGSRRASGSRQHTRAGQQHSTPASDPSLLVPNGIAIANAQTRWPERSASSAKPDAQDYPTQTASWAGDSAVFSHGSDNSDTDGPRPRYRAGISTLDEDQADTMSLDGESGSCSSSEALPDQSPDADDDTGEVTDDEDWARIGAAALRQGSRFGRTGNRPNAVSSVHIDKVHSWDHGGARPPPISSSLLQASGFPSDSAQERDAIEALVRLSSV